MKVIPQAPKPYRRSIRTQYSKPLADLPPVDIVITMGCDVACPSLPCRYREDWGLEDPTGKDDETFLKVIRQIHEDVELLKERIRQRDIP